MLLGRTLLHGVSYYENEIRDSRRLKLLKDKMTLKI